MNNLLEHIVAFCRHLRNEGFLIGFKEVEDSLRAVNSVDISDREQFLLALKIVLCSCKNDHPVFDQAFNQFFMKDKADKTMVPFLSEPIKAERKPVQHLSNAGKQTAEENERLTGTSRRSAKEITAPKEGATGGADGVPQGNSEAGEPSGKAVNWLAARTANKHEQKLEAPVSPIQLYEMEMAARNFVQRIQLKQSRRFKANKKGRKLDGRRTMRTSLQTGGKPVSPVWTGRKKEEANFVLLCDSSRSMSAYASRFLQYAFALTECSRHVEVFLFSTKLKRVTAQLSKDKFGQLPILNVQGDEWGSGTCIGESLFSFVKQNGAQMLRKNTVVMIASDGLDTGDISNLQWAMREIKQRSSLVIWLNPLLSIPGYQPEARSMKAALPYIDIFSAAQSAESFRKLAKTIQIRR